MSKGGVPCLRDNSIYIQAGIDPRTGEPVKGRRKYDVKSEIMKGLRVLDEQECVNRYQWYNLPNNISSNELERLLYYKGQLAFFYFEETQEMWFTGYTLTSPDEKGAIPALDCQGRYRYITPVPLFEGASDEEKKSYDRLRTLLSLKKLKVAYGPKLDEVEWKDITTTAFILRDYTPQQGQIIIPRQQLNDSILDLEAVCFPYMRTALKNGTGVRGLRVNNQDESSNVYAFNATKDVAAIEGDELIPVIGGLEFQELADKNVATAEEFLLAMQSLDNYRCSLIGIENGGIYQKEERMLVNEQEMNAGVSSIPLQDGLTNRQWFCTIVNSYMPLGIWCEIKENNLGIDRDGDGESSENDPSQSGFDNNEGMNEGGGNDDA